jgi:lipoprotein-releasing system permease protein
MKFELFVAARYLRARRRQAVIGLVTLISVLGVAAGVAALIIALAITNGMRRDLQDRLVGATAQVELTRLAADGISDWRPLLQRLAKVDGVTAASPGLYGQVLISRGPRSGGALVKGIVPAEEVRTGDLLRSVPASALQALAPAGAVTSGAETAGTDATGTDATGTDAISTAAISTTPPIVIGAELATTLGAQTGDTLLVTSPQGELTPLGLTPRYQRFQVVGIFSSGFYQYDAGYAFLRLADAQQLFSEPDVISVISFKLRDLYAARQVAQAIETAAGKGFATTTWMEQNRELFRALRLEQTVTFIVLALIVVVAALNILIALTMMVMEKTRDIAVMMSFGVRASQVRLIFLLQGLLISLLGTGIGLVVGLAVSAAGAHFHFISLDASVYSIDTLPFAPKLTDALAVTALSLLTALLATLGPSAAAARVLPAEGLRYE